MPLRSILAASVVLSLASCSTPERDTDMGGLPPGGADDDGGTSGDGADDTSGEDGSPDGSGDGGGDGGDNGGVRFDVGDEGTGGGGDDMGDQGCQAVDFLFVIDNSQSMEDDQVRLIAAFPEFIDGIQNTIQAEDFHIGVITTDDHVYDYDTYYNGQPKTECDVMGGLVTENWDYGSNTQRICGPFVSGANYLTEDEPDLTQKFECIAFVDDEGSTDEAPMAAITAALQDPPISCNQGFLRDDALLVVVLITDEDDDPEPGGNPGSGGTPQQWYDAVLAAKGGNPDHAVVLALAGTPDCNYEHTVRIEQFVDMFGDNGFFGPVCQDNYGQFFKDSVPVVDSACDDFVPPG